MKLIRVSVKNLFGIYNYDLSFENSDGEYVSIIHAPNGKGKTTILKMIQATFQTNIFYLDMLPFQEFKLVFDNEQCITVVKKDMYFSMFGMDTFGDYMMARQSISERAKIEKRDMPENIKSNIKYLINDKEYSISIDSRIMYMILRRFPIDAPKSDDFLETAISRLSDDGYNVDDFLGIRELVQDLNSVIGESNIYYIKTNRLFRKNNTRNTDRPKYRSESRESIVSTVEMYRDELNNNIVSLGKQFADMSEKLDRSFPQRVLNVIFGKDERSEIYTKEKIIELLQTLEEKRSELSEYGLITDADDSLVSIPDNEELNDETRIFLTNYINDNIAKLEVYQEMSEKLKRFVSIINDKNVFSDKKMVFKSDEGMVFVLKNNKTIPIDKLSSGEKNTFILFYELIFSCDKNSMLLIDEPEISLHVSWQRQFIDELYEICKMRELQAIVATHSPDIVSDYFDCMVCLEDKEDGTE